jgi:hypothetical protein
MVPSTIGPYATRHDFANLLAPKIERLRGMADQAKRRASTPLQDYVVARLDGRETGVSFLDRMDLHAAIRTCEMLGTAACFGRKAHFEDLDRERQRTARTLGFEIARRGEDGIDELLREMWMSFLRRRNASEGGFGRQAFGALHYFLRMDPKQPRPKDQAFVALRTVVGDFMKENFPLGPGATVFGEPILERKVHSVRTLSIETGLNPRRLVKTLYLAGVVANEQLALSDHNIVFDALKAREAVRDAVGTLPYRDVAMCLGIGRHQVIMLVQAKLIESATSDNPLGMRFFLAKSKVDEFVSRLTAVAEPVSRKGPNHVSIAEAALRGNCSQVAVVELVLERKLKWVGRLGRKAAYNSILVDLAEIRWLVARGGSGVASAPGIREGRRIQAGGGAGLGEERLRRRCGREQGRRTGGDPARGGNGFSGALCVPGGARRRRPQGLSGHQTGACGEGRFAGI